MPPSDTSMRDLLQSMESATVEWLIIEVLKPEDFTPANPAFARMDKKKNHWVFRLVLSKSFAHVTAGRPRRCRSVRVSVEPSRTPDVTLCHDLTFKAMPHGMEQSTSALKHFIFKLPKEKGKQLRVNDFATAGRSLLPFSYKIVAKTIVAAQPKAKGRSRSEKDRGEVREHLNGCRDFSTQWFIQCYLGNLVPWQDVNYNQFHDIIGIRYGERNEHVSPIAEAAFHSHTRLLECPVHYHNGSEVVQECVPLPYQTDASISVPVYQSYDHEQLRQPYGGAGSSSRANFDERNVHFSDWRLQ